MKGAPTGSWLDPTEQREISDLLLHYGIIKFDNDRSLPLKSGGKTDIYINERDVRSHPEALRGVVHAYENPLRRLDIARFVEVPEAVSGIAGALEYTTGIPYLTIREEEKAGRVTKGKVIGDYRRGDRVAIVDDVITDGASKLVPYRECLANGLDVRALVVLVDRQQGWQKKFAAEGVSLSVWAGMTLHDVRRYLIESGAMRRCNPAAEENNPVIVALDNLCWDDALPLLDRLRPSGCIIKVNDLLFNKGIEWLLPNLSIYGRIMADLKAHDIGNTVATALKHLRACPPWAVTIHASGGQAMVAAAVKALEGTPTKVLAVTVLTSIDPKTSREVYNRRPWDEVKVLARCAKKMGAHGFVCSPKETAALRKLVGPDMLIVNPAVRSPGADAGDQKRVDTPAAAMASGANYIVGGRQFLGAADPVAEILRVKRDELKIAA